MKNIKPLTFIFLLFVCSFSVMCQEVKNTRKEVWRVNILNPGIEYEMSTGKSSVISLGLGIGYSVSYPHSSLGDRSGFISSFNPFFDAQYKWFYNFDKREKKSLKINNNSGNFIAARILTRGESLFGNSNGTENIDFAIGPTWGIQRVYGEKFHFLFDLGPIYYFDINGRKGFFPLMIQINFGINL